VSASALAAIAAAALVLLATLTAALWNWAGRSRDRASSDRTVARPAERGPIAGPASESGPKATGPGPRPAAGNPEDPVRDAMAAVRGGNLNRARLLLDRYLSRPQSGKQVDAARTLRDDLDLATSSVEAQAQAQQLSDQEIKDYLETGVQSLVESNVQTPELRSVYAKTLLKAFRQESSRRRSAPKNDVSLARGPEPGPSRAPAPVRKAPSAGGIAPATGEVPDRKGPATIETVLNSPGAFAGRTILLDGLYRVGTRLTPLKGPDGSEIGVSLPVAGDDDRLICKGDGRIVGRDGYLVLDRSLAPYLLRGFDEYKFRRASRPEHKTTLTVTVSRMDASNSGAPVVSIVGLEILGVCNLLRVAEGHYERSFLTLRVAPGTSSVAYGDGAAWVERLGGEERFLKPLHRRLRELRRKMVAERINAAAGPYLQAALAQSMNMAVANAQQQSRMIQAFTGRR
jgi:hypothetical protein